MSRYKVIAIDGPSASGKSTLARALAKKLKFNYLDTGALYRACAWKLIQERIDLKDKKKVSDSCRRQKIEFKQSGDRLKMFVNGEDITSKIRNNKVSEAASIISKLGSVRKVMTCNQRQMAKKRNIVLEGRDIGTVVFPGADCKIFLDASLQERTKRRFKEYLNKEGNSLDKGRLKADLKRRDKRDSSRKIAPLRKAGDAILLDSTNLSIRAVICKALQIISQRDRVNVL